MSSALHSSISTEEKNIEKKMLVISRKKADSLNSQRDCQDFLLARVLLAHWSQRISQHAGHGEGERDVTTSRMGQERVPWTTAQEPRGCTQTG